MSHSPPPPPHRLPCQRDPERWLERRHRRDALAGCLSCPARSWCARRALACRASWGTWAGVWIDGHAAAAPYLRAIAADDPAPAAPRRALTAGPPPRARRPPAPLQRPPAPGPAASARVAVLARSCGHCEVFAEGCRRGFDRLLSRREPARDDPCPAEVFAACAACAQIVDRMQPQLAARLGYRLDGAADPAGVPFYWRSARWVLLDRDGWLTETGQQARHQLAT